MTIRKEKRTASDQGCNKFSITRAATRLTLWQLMISPRAHPFVQPFVLQYEHSGCIYFMILCFWGPADKPGVIFCSYEEGRKKRSPKLLWAKGFFSPKKFQNFGTCITRRGNFKFWPFCEDQNIPTIAAAKKPLAESSFNLNYSENNFYTHSVW